jgi:hypothetical protein
MEMSFALGGWSLNELALRIQLLSTEAPAIASVICATQQLRPADPWRMQNRYVRKSLLLVLDGNAGQRSCNFAVLNSIVYPTIANETCWFPKNMWAT